MTDNTSETQTVNIGELLLEIKVAYEKMGVQNSHKHLLLQAGAVIISLYEENQKVKKEIYRSDEENQRLEEENLKIKEEGFGPWRQQLADEKPND